MMLRFQYRWKRDLGWCCRTRAFGSEVERNAATRSEATALLVDAVRELAESIACIDPELVAEPGECPDRYIEVDLRVQKPGVLQ